MRLSNSLFGVLIDRGICFSHQITLVIRYFDMIDNNIVNIRNLSIGYDRKNILSSQLNMSCRAGEFIALVGRNGMGKSTLLRVLAGLSVPLSGQVSISGVDIHGMDSLLKAKTVSFVSTDVVKIAHLRVWDVVAMGRSPYTGWSGALSVDDEMIVRESLDKVGVLSLQGKSMDQLSDGERSRVMIARALAQDTKVMILDEPTAFLDLANRYQVSLLLRNLAHSTNKIIITSTHDLSTVLSICDTVWVMSHDGVTVGTPSEVRSNGALQSIFAGTDLRVDPVTGQIMMIGVNENSMSAE